MTEWPYREEGGAWCPTCMGEGEHDMRDTDAILSEHLPVDIVDRLKRRPGWMGTIPCQECEGTGVVTVDRYRDMMAAARAFVDQAIARYEEEEHGSQH